MSLLSEIKQLRAKLTIKQIAEVCGVPPKTIYRWLKQEFRPSWALTEIITRRINEWREANE